MKSRLGCGCVGAEKTSSSSQTGTSRSAKEGPVMLCYGRVGSIDTAVIDAVGDLWMRGWWIFGECEWDDPQLKTEIMMPHWRALR